jgi:hypothetical protein
MFDKHVMGSRALDDAQWATPLALEAVVGAKSIFTVLEPLVVDKFGYRVTVTFNYDTQTAEGKIALYKRITPGSDTGRVKLAEMKLVNARAAEHIYVLKVSDVENQAKCVAGQQIVIEVSVAATGGASIAGDFQPFWIGHPTGEVNMQATYYHLVTE